MTEAERNWTLPDYVHDAEQFLLKKHRGEAAEGMILRKHEG